MIDEFTGFAEGIQNDSSHQSAVKVYDTAFNTFMPSTVFEESSIQANIITAIRENKDNVVLNQSIKNMLKSAADYMTKLSNSWDRDALPDAFVPFSNQVNILYY